MKGCYNKNIYLDEELVKLASGAILIKSLGKAYWQDEFSWFVDDTVAADKGQPDRFKLYCEKQLKMAMKNLGDCISKRKFIDIKDINAYNELVKLLNENQK